MDITLESLLENHLEAPNSELQWDVCDHHTGIRLLKQNSLVVRLTDQWNCIMRVATKVSKHGNYSRHVTTQGYNDSNMFQMVDWLLATFF